MSLFQHIVIKKQIASHAEKVRQAYALYAAYFLNPDIQENIRNSKEEQFQEGFLRELFVKILGYTLNPEPDYNLITEKKNETNSKKADGAIIIQGEVKGVIELKDHKTTDLKQVEAQAFGYKNNNRKTSYVIISNFEKLRFYIENTIDFEEFNLFTLTTDEFAVLWICLAYENIAKDLPKQLKNESTSNEEQITKQLYKDYSTFKRELYADLTFHNSDIDKLTLFKKTQKLLDRLLFIFFAEDCDLLPPNSMSEIITQWEKLKELDEYKPLYDRIKKYFGYMNTGFKGKKYDVFAYNGGLFKPDEVLDNVVISDEVLRKYSLQLSQYDFASEVDVNILGHIFENSLSEIESVMATFAVTKNTDIPVATVFKRKKDGVFYTPRYITTYIVENTLGKLCSDKKTELVLDEAEYFSDKKRAKPETKRLSDKLTVYRDWLLSLTICDPACGSGAFLNAALDFLMNEHHLVDAMTAKLFGNAIVFSNIENAILENNLYGVDINEESVEIAQLSLWLRTAKPQRKLNSLNNNIKCGNSLISDPEVAGDKAFDWHKEFPQVFEKGGFDVVIGNPPYVLCQPSNTQENILNYYKQFKVASYKIDLFHLFFERGINLLKPNGKLGYITPNTYLTNTYIEKLRSYLLNNLIYKLILNAKGVFEDASVDVCTIFINKIIPNNNVIEVYKMDKLGNIASQALISQNQWENNSAKIFNIQIQYQIDTNNTCLLGNIATITFGLQTKDKDTYVKNIKIDNEWELCYTGRDISRYYLNEANLYFKNFPEDVKAGGSWNMDIHHSVKIVVRQIGAPEPVFSFDRYGYATLNTMYSIVLKDTEKISYKYLLAILCSSMIKEWWLSMFSDNKDLFPKIKGNQLKEIPIKTLSIEEQQPFIDLANQMLSLNADLQTKRHHFLKRLSDNFTGIKITGVLEHFDELVFKQFLAALGKQKITLSLKQQDEWEEYFNEYQSVCSNFIRQIDATDKEIDRRVHELYGLTEEDVRIG
ncbi:Type IIS restriction enzyme Eco57I [termite gut metagenome]|uniref:site-specific DNA-methyltransferase (adenine-specific) n=2 Tax=termite gut metagenome TaxID=433724 RepID=A0A5J4R6Z3_9ZZZZ